MFHQTGILGISDEDNVKSKSEALLLIINRIDIHFQLSS